MIRSNTVSEPTMSARSLANPQRVRVDANGEPVTVVVPTEE